MSTVHRILGHVSRRLDRPEILAAASAGARRDLWDAVSARTLMAAWLRADSSFVDIGSNRGQWMRDAVRVAPDGRHAAFEPIPALARALVTEFPGVDVHATALADEQGTERFCHFPALDGFSGLRRREDVDAVPEWIEVRVARLDDEIGSLRPTLLKIDVEGAELGVMRGARQTIETHRPWIVFEHQPEASAIYDTRSHEIPEFLHGLDYRIFTLQADGPLGREEFSTAARGGVINWIAAPR